MECIFFKGFNGMGFLAQNSPSNILIAIAFVYCCVFAEMHHVIGIDPALVIILPLFGQATQTESQIGARFT